MLGIITLLLLLTTTTTLPPLLLCGGGGVADPLREVVVVGAQLSVLLQQPKPQAPQLRRRGGVVEPQLRERPRVLCVRRIRLPVRDRPRHLVGHQRSPVLRAPRVRLPALNTNMHDMTNMSHIQKICKPLAHVNTPF